jgi:hypothetical protein
LSLVSEQHLSIRQAANNLGISDGALGRWLRESKTPERAKKNQPNHFEDKRIRDLEAEVITSPRSGELGGCEQPQGLPNYLFLAGQTSRYHSLVKPGINRFRYQKCSNLTVQNFSSTLWDKNKMILAIPCRMRQTLKTRHV